MINHLNSISSRTRSRTNSVSSSIQSLTTPAEMSLIHSPPSSASNNSGRTQRVLSDNSNEALEQLGLNIDLSGLSEESKKLVSILLSGISVFIDKRLHKTSQEYETKLIRLEKRIETLEDKLDTLENYGRRESLVLSGPIVTNDSPNRNPRNRDSEDCLSIVSKVCTEQLGVNLPKEMISVAHRLGKLKESGPDKRSIIFRLVRRDLKYSIFKACRIKKPQFSINESVSPLRNTIMYVLRKAREEYPRKFGRNFTEEGNVRLMIPKTDGAKEYDKRTINTKHELDDLLRVKINKTSLDFGARWDRVRPVHDQANEHI